MDKEIADSAEAIHTSFRSLRSIFKTMQKETW